MARGEWRGAHDVEAIVADLFAEPRTTSANPIQVMTIHRSKGLEFDHVFLPSLDRMLNRDRDPLLRWLDLPRGDSGSDLLIAPVPIVWRYGRRGTQQLSQAVGCGTKRE